MIPQGIARYGRIIIDKTSSKTTTALHKKIWAGIQKEIQSKEGKTLLRKLKTKGDIYVAANGPSAISLTVKNAHYAWWSDTGKVLPATDRNGCVLTAIIQATEDMGKNIANFFARCREYAGIKQI